MGTPDLNRRSRRRSLLWAAMLCSLLLIGLAAWRWAPVDVLFLVYPLIGLAAFGLFCALTAWALVRLTGRRAVLWASMLSSLLLIALTVWRWTLMEVLTPFREFLVEFAVFGLFFAVVAWSFVSGLIGLWRKRRAALLPLGVGLLSLAAVLVLPITEWVLEYDFRTGLSSREEVVRVIESGELQNAGMVVTSSSPLRESYVVRLPSKYSHLSKGGEVIVERDRDNLTVLFFTFQGILDNFSGFVYSSSDRLPPKEGLYSDVFQSFRLLDHWYWVASA